MQINLNTMYFQRTKAVKYPPLNDKETSQETQYSLPGWFIVDTCLFKAEIWTHRATSVEQVCNFHFFSKAGLVLEFRVKNANVIEIQGVCRVIQLILLDPL